MYWHSYDFLYLLHFMVKVYYIYGEPDYLHLWLKFYYIMVGFYYIYSGYYMGQIHRFAYGESN